MGTSNLLKLFLHSVYFCIVKVIANKMSMGHIAHLDNNSHLIVNNLHMKYQLIATIIICIPAETEIFHFFKVQEA